MGMSTSRMHAAFVLHSESTAVSTTSVVGVPGGPDAHSMAGRLPGTTSGWTFGRLLQAPSMTWRRGTQTSNAFGTGIAGVCGVATWGSLWGVPLHAFGVWVR